VRTKQSLSTSRLPLRSSSGRSTAPGPRMSYPKSSRPGLSQPRWMSESPRVSTRDRRSCLTFVSDHQPPNVVGKTLMIPVYQRLFGVSDNFDGGVRVGRFVFVGDAHVCKWGLGGAQSSQAALHSSSLGFQVSATDDTPRSNRLRRSPLQLAASGHQVRTQRPARRSSPFSPTFQESRDAVDGR
jgi:hypothetical protein